MHAIIFISAYLIAGLLHAQNEMEWYSIGLAESRVHCLLADDSTKVLAGTDQGLHALFQGKWYPVEGLASNVPVHALVRISEREVIAAVGGGSNSDGIYIGEAIIKGPPFYSFSLVDYLMFPQSLAAGNRKKDTVYIGAQNSIYIITADKEGNYGSLQEVPTPPNSFGVEMPRCAALQVSRHILWAGGYDLSPEPGPGHLLVQKGDGMVALKNWNVTSITEVHWGVGPMNFIDLYTAAGDSGVLKYEPQSSSTPWTNMGNPGGEPVRHLMNHAYFVTQAGPYGVLHAASPEGVYSLNNGDWTEIGDIPAAPTVLASGGISGNLYAGTEKGVYRYGRSPPVRNREKRVSGGPVPGIALEIKPHRSYVTIGFVLPSPGKVSMHITDLSARVVAEITKGLMPAGRLTFRWDMGGKSGRRVRTGVYLLRLSTDTDNAVRRLVVN